MKCQPALSDLGSPTRVSAAPITTRPAVYIVIDYLDQRLFSVSELPEAMVSTCPRVSASQAARAVRNLSDAHSSQGFASEGVNGISSRGASRGLNELSVTFRLPSERCSRLRRIEIEMTHLQLLLAEAGV